MPINLSQLLDRTFWKFILVGVANTVFGTAVMLTCYNLLGCSYWLSSAANYVLGSILSYFLNKHFTFQSREKGWRVMVLFVLNIAACYLIAYGVAKPLTLWLLSDLAQRWQENIAMLVGACLFVAINYVGQRFWVFRPKP